MTEVQASTYQERQAARRAYLDKQASDRRGGPTVSHKWGAFIHTHDGRWATPVFFKTRQAAVHWAEQLVETRRYIVGRY